MKILNYKQTENIRPPEQKEAPETRAKPENRDDLYFHHEVAETMDKHPYTRESIGALMQKNYGTALHCLGMANQVPDLAKSLQINRQQKEHLIIAALTHDYGKIKWPDNTFLQKNPPSYGARREHIRESVRFLEEAGAPPEVVEIVQCHHARDGYGGYSENHIVHIFEILDKINALEAAENERPYKQSWSSEEIYREIRNAFRDEPGPQGVIDKLEAGAKHDRAA